MLITSKFRDYYDSIVAFGVDKAVVYDRRESLHVLAEKYTPHEEVFEFTRQGEKFRYTVWKFVVGFCGELYPVVEFRREVVGGTRSRFFYDAVSLREFTDKLKLKREKYGYYWHKDFKVLSEGGPEAFFSGESFKDLKAEFRSRNVPVFMVGRLNKDRGHRDHILLNPCLRELQFQKVKDPVTAFQAIYMFISGYLGVGEKPMVKLTDKELAKKKGHGGKYSFRKTPKEKS